MRILFCDDNPQILRQTQKLVTDYFQERGNDLPDFFSYDSGDALLAEKPVADLAFLDVEMPGVSGIYVASQLRKWNRHILLFIVTAYPDYLDEALRTQAFRFLSKPLNKERFFRNLDDAMQQYLLCSQSFLVELNTGIVRIFSSDIICLESAGNKTVLHTLDGDLPCARSMDALRHLLQSPCFFQTHRSFIINLQYIHQICPNYVLLKYQEREIIALLARRNSHQLRKAFLLFAGGAAL